MRRIMDIYLSLEYLESDPHPEHETVRAWTGDGNLVSRSVYLESIVRRSSNPQEIGN